MDGECAVTVDNTQIGFGEATSELIPVGAPGDFYARTWVPRWWPFGWPRKFRYLGTLSPVKLTEVPWQEWEE